MMISRSENGLIFCQVCYEGDDAEDGSKNYECPRPLWGKYLTFQKAKIKNEFGMVINEVYVFVVKF